MKNLIILFCLSALSIANSYGQTIIKSNWGAIEEFYPWKDGYIGTAHKLTYAIVSKSVSFQYFDKNGNFKWETKVNPFNHSNEIVVGDHSEYAYLINKAYTKTAALEKKSATNFINLFRIDSRGKLKKKSFLYKGAFAYLKESTVISLDYLEATKDGLIMVVRSKIEGGEDESHLFRISNSLEVKKVKLGFEWDYNSWIGSKVSKLNFISRADELSVIQVKNTESGIEFTVETYQTSDLEKISEGVTIWPLKDKIIGSGVSRIASSSYAKNYVSYSHSYSRGDSYITSNKLGSMFDYQFVEDKLYVVATAMGAKSKKPMGFYNFALDLEDESEITDPTLIKFEKKSVISCLILLGPKVTYVVNYGKAGYYTKSTYYGSVNGGKVKLLPKELKRDKEKAMAFVSGWIKIDDFKSVTSLFMRETNYVVVEMKKPNAAGGSKKVVVKQIPVK